MILKISVRIFPSVSNECAVNSVATHSVKIKILLSLSYTSDCSRGNSPWAKRVSSSTLSLCWCSGCLLITSKERDKTWGSRAFIWRKEYTLYTQLLTRPTKTTLCQRKFCGDTHPWCRIHLCSNKMVWLAASQASHPP